MHFIGMYSLTYSNQLIFIIRSLNAFLFRIYCYFFMQLSLCTTTILAPKYPTHSDTLLLLCWRKCLLTYWDLFANFTLSLCGGSKYAYSRSLKKQIFKFSATIENPNNQSLECSSTDWQLCRLHWAELHQSPSTNRERTIHRMHSCWQKCIISWVYCEWQMCGFIAYEVACRVSNSTTIFQYLLTMLRLPKLQCIQRIRMKINPYLNCNS